MTAVLVLLLTGRDYWQMLADSRLSDVSTHTDHVCANLLFCFLLIIIIKILFSGEPKLGKQMAEVAVCKSIQLVIKRGSCSV